MFCFFLTREEEHSGSKRNTNRGSCAGRPASAAGAGLGPPPLGPLLGSWTPEKRRLGMKAPVFTGPLASHPPHTGYIRLPPPDTPTALRSPLPHWTSEQSWACPSLFTRGQHHAGRDLRLPPRVVSTGQGGIKAQTWSLRCRKETQELWGCRASVGLSWGQKKIQRIKTGEEQVGKIRAGASWILPGGPLLPSGSGTH